MPQTGNRTEINLGFAKEPIIAGAIELLGAIGLEHPATGISVGVLSTIAFSTWQNKNFQQFQFELERKFKGIEQEKIDKSFIASDEFKALIVQGLEAAIKASSSERCEALANAILSSAILPTSKFRNKQTILRVLSQITDEEIIALKILDYYEYYLKASNKPTDVVSVEQLSEEMSLDIEETRVTCDGLLQLGLAYDTEGQSFDSMGKHRQSLRITALGRRVIQYSIHNE